MPEDRKENQGGQKGRAKGRTEEPLIYSSRREMRLGLSYLTLFCLRSHRVQSTET